tara:strand:+ start:19141 stop:21927 length:2787 start_codon:yes stop_codon:yes gene_type:complete
MSDEAKKDEKTFKTVTKKLEDIGYKFEHGHWKNISDAKYNNEDTFRFLYHKATGWDYDPTTFFPTAIDLRKLEITINRFNKSLGKPNGWFASYFKLPRTMLKKLPELDRFQQEMLRESSYFRSQTFSGTKNVNSILKNFKDLSKSLGTDTKKVALMDKQLDKAQTLVNTRGNSQDIQKLNELQIARHEMYRSGAADSHLALIKALEGQSINSIPELKTSMDRAKMSTIVGHWDVIRGDTSTSLIRGVQKVISLAKGNPKYNTMIDELKSKIRTITFQQVVDNRGNSLGNKSFKGTEDLLKFGFTVENGFRDAAGNVSYRKYLPHYVLGIPKMIRNMDKLFRGEHGEKSSEQLNKEIQEQFNTLDTYIKRLDKRNDNLDNAYYSDPFYFMNKYVSDVSIFNYRTHVKDTFKRAHNELYKNHLMPAQESGNKNSALMLENMMKMTNDVYETLNHIDPVVDSASSNMMRMLTSLTYFRLLGGNFRSAARNATQRIHEIHNFGLDGLKEAKNYYNEAGSANENKAIAEDMAKKYGLLWFSGDDIKHRVFESFEGGAGISEASRGALEGSFIAEYGLKVTPQGELVKSNESFTKLGAKMTAKVAEKSAFMHRLVEDWNRTNTFKVSFALAHQNLKSMPKEWVQNKSGKESSKDINKWIDNEAGKIAYNSVIDIHYEYAKWAKAKGMQGKTGQFLGQFMHYRFSLFDMMYKWMDDAGVSLRTGDFTSDEVWRMGRLGMTTAMIGGVFAPLLNTKLSGLFQNDVKETAETAYTFLTTDRDDKKAMEKLDKITYGQGGFYFAGPNVNYLMSMAELKDHFFMDEISSERYLNDIGFIPTEQTNKRYKIMSLINAQAARTWNYSAPLFYKRGFFDAARMELGLFPDEDVKSIRNVAKKWLGENVHHSLGVKTKKKGRPRKTLYSDKELADISTSMGLF